MTTYLTEPATLNPWAAARGVLTFQLVDHWGNRTTPRPRPRLDVLLAALVLGTTAPPHGGAAVLPGVAAALSRYTAYLVRRCWGGEAAQAEWQPLLAALVAEPRYRDAVDSGADAVNRAILTFCTDLAAHLLADGGDAVLPGLPRRTGVAPARIIRVGARLYRLRPWPLCGRRLTLHTLPPWSPPPAAVPGAADPSRYASLAWTLLAPSTPIDRRAGEV